MRFVKAQLIGNAAVAMAVIAWCLLGILFALAPLLNSARRGAATLPHTGWLFVALIALTAGLSLSAVAKAGASLTRKDNSAWPNLVAVALALPIFLFFIFAWVQHWNVTV